MSNYAELLAKIVKAEGNEGRINLIFVDKEKIRQLNRDFRSKDQPTDVLSFEMGEDGIIGDIAVCRAEAGKFSIKHLVVHGALHLLGYDHGKEMNRAEKTYQKF